MKKNRFITHLTTVIIITVLSALIYVSVQQSYRSGANDPQLQLANDITNALRKNHPIEHLLPKDTIEISENTAPFIVLYNDKGEPIQSTGLLDGNLPQLPQGVFDFARRNGEDVVTWQPKKGVRMAMVVESLASSNVAFVAAGRSLKEVEKREGNLATMVMIGWLICIGAVGLHWIITGFNRIKQ